LATLLFVGFILFYIYFMHFAELMIYSISTSCTSQSWWFILYLLHALRRADDRL